MNENNNESNMGAEVSNTDMTVAAVSRNVAKLPKAQAASIHIAGNRGKKTDGSYEVSAFVIMVKCNGEWRPENEWLHKAGMKCQRRVYTSIEKARAAKADILAKWGMVKATKTTATKKELESELASVQAELAALKALFASKAA